ncbi:heat-inducible transcriptional repressor HrcA [Luteimonas sp. e5]
MNESLDPRARQLLRTLISRHIADGAPVGSQTLAKHAGLQVSPATIRNILADLEEQGLLASPHTSAGRVPTTRGYRVFVDSLLQCHPLQAAELERLRSELAAPGDTRQLLGSASQLLSAMSRFVGVVAAPRTTSLAFRYIDFVTLDEHRVLAILVLHDGSVQNRVLELGQAYAPATLEEVANYLNAHFAGQPLQHIHRQLLAELKSARDRMQTLLTQAVALAEQALLAPDGEEEDLLLAGQTRLMGAQAISDVDRLRELFEAFARKRDILQLLERTLHAPGVRIFIGEETGLAPLEQTALVAAPYGRDGEVLGVLGVIGPTRMAYERVIPVVQATADVLGEAIGGR